MTSSKPRILQAIDALNALDRDRAVAILEEEVRLADPVGDRWKSASRLAARIGEIDIALESARRYSRTPPVNLERILFYTGELAGYGREEEAAAEIRRLPPAAAAHQTVQHFLGTMAAQRGEFAEAEAYFRRALGGPQAMPHSWLSLSTIKRFAAGDPDIAEMERQRPRMIATGDEMAARFHYALGKAWHDAGDFDRAWASYTAGAELRRRATPYDAAAMRARVERIVRELSRDAIDRLTPSGEREARTIFVNGLPRSGTTLVEQILASHSQVADGGESTLFYAALLPAGDASLAGAQAYDRRGRADPWGDVARNYHRMTAMLFRTERLTVDKTLLQSMHMGLLLHALPDARVIWLRRNAADTAISCFRTYFSADIPWSWSMADLGHYSALEDQLHAHWTAQFPDRILTVEYEALTRSPGEIIPRILAHCGLPEEPQVYESHKTKRAVRTASVAQVREPISTARIGGADPYAAHMAPFHAAYNR